MKRAAILLVLVFLAGCSNAPIAGFLDSCFPSKPAECAPPRPRNPVPNNPVPPGVVPGVGPGDLPTRPAGLGGPVGPPGPGN